MLRLLLPAVPAAASCCCNCQLSLLLLAVLLGGKITAALLYVAAASAVSAELEVLLLQLPALVLQQTLVELPPLFALICG